MGKPGHTFACSIKVALKKTTVFAVLGKIQVMSFFEYENGTLQ